MLYLWEVQDIDQASILLHTSYFTAPKFWYIIILPQDYCRESAMMLYYYTHLSLYIYIYIQVYKYTSIQVKVYKYTWRLDTAYNVQVNKEFKIEKWRKERKGRENMNTLNCGLYLQLSFMFGFHKEIYLSMQKNMDSTF